LFPGVFDRKAAPKSVFSKGPDPGPLFILGIQGGFHLHKQDRGPETGGGRRFLGV